MGQELGTTLPEAENGEVWGKWQGEAEEEEEDT